MTAAPVPVLIRPARLEDARAIAALHIRSWQATYRGLLSAGFLAGLDTSLERRVAWFEKAIGEGVPTIHVAEAEGALLGWCSCGASRDEDVAPATGELMAIYLQPEAWGRGVGGRLWRVARQALEEAGFAAVTAWVLDGNLRAIRFYQGAGFVADAASQRTFEENGEPLPLTRFHLPLRTSA
ncbi:MULTISPECIES: GNAT family N-acetyltransferase [unclassified Pseudomonas]|uniref:GNAT family N-acetyltransferase n=1 Tax=unclassified Pseudomonas TaxID=196821 RepID=UPI00244BC0A4|nr:MULTISPECIES: GNAT family N-acetyltransferase [unclassified Pseudomonas]MDG9927276.1 GNAT family N-acetyltransferase [Pseudomonas sp. GD04042]MDH0482345.1 GNAT family N-acetyltransferase [Pseudomonas sp. GD04015]MDH0602698.1 GNAT family N-acetyltransferase [Pseudomonas sp. GD03869]